MAKEIYMSTEDDKQTLDGTTITPEELKVLQDELVSLREAKEESSKPSDDKVKSNIDKAYSERDALAAEVKTLRDAKRDAELKALEDAGKKDEADKIRMDEMKDRMKVAEAQVTTLTRDNALRSALAGMDFVSDKAADVAYNDIVGRLVRNADGDWVSSTGQSIKDFAKFYQDDEGNKFLFKVKQSSGSQAMDRKSVSGEVKSNKTIKEMSNEELIAAAENGDFDGKNTWL